MQLNEEQDKDQQVIVDKICNLSEESKAVFFNKLDNRAKSCERRGGVVYVWLSHGTPTASCLPQLFASGKLIAIKGKDVTLSKAAKRIIEMINENAKENQKIKSV